jgi:hypothetical protein
VLTSVSLEPLWSLIPSGPKQSNVIKAVAAYASNETFPAADLSNYTMGWCDCGKIDISGPSHACVDNPGSQCWTETCPFGKTLTSLEKFSEGNIETATCCRPYFAAAN